MASKTKLTPTLQEKICNLLRHGNYVETAARCAGIHRDTFYTWMKKGEEGVEPYAAFNEAVHEALALGEALDLAKIEKAATTNWTAAAWRLERRFPERWGRTDRVKVDGKVGVDVSDDRLLAKLARLVDEAADASAKPADAGATAHDETTKDIPNGAHAEDSQ